MDVEERLYRGTPAYRRALAVLFVAGFLTFFLLYVAQGLLPALSDDFAVSPAMASLALSATTLPLAGVTLVAASWSEGLGRRPLLVGSVVLAAVLTCAAAASPHFGVLLALRFLTGIALAGFPAVAMAYLGEEIHPGGLGTAMGLYVSGTGLGGMCGRLLGSLAATWWGWRWAIALVGLIGVLGGIWVAARLPASRHFVAARGSLVDRIALIREPLADPVMIRLAVCGFVIMGSLVSYYNYLQYRLARPPFSVSAVVISLTFVLYVCGTVSANVMGRRGDTTSRRRVMLVGIGVMAAGALLSLVPVFPVVLVGTAAMIFGFFGTHAVASSFVGVWSLRRRAQASALYLLGYYAGSSAVGYVGGLFYSHLGWTGEVGMILVLLVTGAVVTAQLPVVSRQEILNDAT